MSSIVVKLTDPLPLSLTLRDGATGLYPQAHVYDESDVEVLGSPFDLTEQDTGRYTNQAFTPDTQEVFVGKFIVYNDAGHTSESAVHGRAEETYVTTVGDIVWDEILSGATHNIPTSAGKRLRQIQENLGYEGGAVYIDTINGTPGTVPFENGTVGLPVDTIADALTLAVALGLTRIVVYPGSTVTLTDAVEGYTITGENWAIVLAGYSVSNTFIHGADVSGICTGAISPSFQLCHFDVVTIPPAHIDRCGLEGTVTIGAAGTFFFDRCHSGVAGTSTPVLDFGSGLNASEINLRGYSGGIELRNMGAGTGTYRMSLEGFGQLIVAASCSANSVVAIRGHFEITDNAGGAVTFADEPMFDHNSKIDRIAGLCQENVYIDNTVFDGNNNLESARLRIYSVAGSVGTGSDVIATYTITAVGTGPGQFSSWKMVKV